MLPFVTVNSSLVSLVCVLKITLSLFCTFLSVPVFPVKFLALYGLHTFTKLDSHFISNLNLFFSLTFFKISHMRLMLKMQPMKSCTAPNGIV